MKRIASFEIDHLTLVKGLYVSRRDTFPDAVTTTFDLRMKTPYTDEPLNPAAAHALEHFLATYLRNYRYDVVYVGVMGCMTGFYVVLAGKKDCADIVGTLIDALEWIQTQSKVVGATPRECGNYSFMDLDDAKREAKEYANVLRSLDIKS